jgi:hypothetical protein
MGEENRGSSGGGTAMMVVAILGGLFVFGCCGGAVVLGLGGGLVWVRSTPVQMQPPPPIAIQADPQVTKAVNELNRDLEPLKITPEDGTTKPVEPGSEESETAPPSKEN